MAKLIQKVAIEKTNNTCWKIYAASTLIKKISRLDGIVKLSPRPGGYYTADLDPRFDLKELEDEIRGLSQ